MKFIFRKGNVDIDDHWQVSPMGRGFPLPWNSAANLLALFMHGLSYSLGFCLVAGGDLFWLLPAGLVEVRLVQVRQ